MVHLAKSPDLFSVVDLPISPLRHRHHNVFHGHVGTMVGFDKEYKAGATACIAEGLPLRWYDSEMVRC